MSVRLLILTALAVAATRAARRRGPSGTSSRARRVAGGGRPARSGPIRPVVDDGARDPHAHRQTARGRVTDGAALDCPGGACTRDDHATSAAAPTATARRTPTRSSPSS